MNEYYSVFHICKISWKNTIWYPVFRNFHEQILFIIWYLEILHERISSVFEKCSTNSIRYSETLHDRIYSVFGIRSNSLFGATPMCNWQHKQVASHATGNTCNWQHKKLVKRVTGKTCNSQHMKLATCFNGFINVVFKNFLN